MEADIAIRDNVIAELDFDPSIDEGAIGVTVRDGVVTLTGHVPSYAQKIAAEKAARRISGVHAVAIDIEVRLPSQVKHDDEEIARRAASVLTWTATLGDRIKAVVDSGWVTLSGEVPWHYQKQEAERVVRNLEGVRGVTNTISVRPQVKVSDIRDRINSAFKRNAELESDAIRVDVSGSTVTLTGKVKAWYERQMAETAAWAAPGVTEVRDNITF
jgi:osmotically-inducible protein OsmY